MTVEDRLEIQELVNRYAYHVDNFHVDQWVSLFAEDALFDETEFGKPPCVGRAALRAFMQELVSETRYAVHLMANHIISELTPTSATGTALALVQGIGKSGETARYFVNYADEYVRTPQGWRFSRRVVSKAYPVELLPLAE